jgi:hypothetical protein
VMVDPGRGHTSDRLRALMLVTFVLLPSQASSLEFRVFECQMPVGSTHFVIKDDAGAMTLLPSGIPVTKEQNAFTWFDGQGRYSIGPRTALFLASGDAQEIECRDESFTVNAVMRDILGREEDFEASSQIEELKSLLSSAIVRNAALQAFVEEIFETWSANAATSWKASVNASNAKDADAAERLRRLALSQFNEEMRKVQETPQPKSDADIQRELAAQIAARIELEESLGQQLNAALARAALAEQKLRVAEEALGALRK